MTKPTIYLVTAVLAAIFFYVVIGPQCDIAFDKGLTDITALLVPYSILGLLIERFVNNFIIPRDNTKLKSTLREMAPRSADGQITASKQLESQAKSEEQVHNPKFVRYSFIVALFVSAVGFRFMAQITDGGANCTTSDWFKFDYKYLFDIVDIFLTAILLSGGSQAINKAVQAMTVRSGV